MKYVLITLVFSILFPATSLCQTFTLLNRSNKINIIIPEYPSNYELEAANIIQKYLAQITSRNIEIINENHATVAQAIYIGRTNVSQKAHLKKINKDGIGIITNKNSLFLYGLEGKAIIYAAYTFLEKYLHCLKLDHNKAITPKLDSIILQQNIYDIQNPSFTYRESYYPNSSDNEFADWHKLHHLSNLWGIWGHSFFKVIPPEKYFTAHPEYYSLLNGKRQALQLCLSNKNVLKIFKLYLEKAFIDYPEAKYWSISPNDNNGFCTCGRCSFYDKKFNGKSGIVVHFVNQIAKSFPNKVFTTLAYNATAKAPNIAPRKNVFIFLSSIDAKRNASLEMENSAKNFRNNLNDWKTLSSNIFIWDYTTQFTNYLTPFPYYEHLSSSLKFLKKNGVKGVFAQGSGNTYSDLADYNNFLQAKLLWDVNANVDSLKNIFLDHYYGGAAVYVKKYLNLLNEKIEIHQSNLEIYDNPINFREDYLSPKYLNEYSNLIDSALNISYKDTVTYNRVKKIKLSIEYIQLQQAKFFGLDSNGYLLQNSTNNQLSIKENWTEKIENFVSDSKKLGVNELAENGLSPDEYAEEWYKIINATKKLNKLYLSKIDIINNFSDDYPAKGSRTLIDNIFGQNDYTYNWLYFYGKDLLATIQCDTIITVDSIRLNFLNDQKHYIFLPEFIQIETSLNGVDYVTMAKMYPKLKENNAISIENFTSNANGIKAKYIRVTAKCREELPYWQNFINRKAAICCDEIFVH